MDTSQTVVPRPPGHPRITWFRQVQRDTGLPSIEMYNVAKSRNVWEGSRYGDLIDWLVRRDTGRHFITSGIRDFQLCFYFLKTQQNSKLAALVR